MERKRAWLAPAVAGGLAGIANGFFGGGGGMVLVPFLTRRCGLDQRRAALPYLAGGLLGGWAGGKLFRRVNMIWLRRAFALLILYGGAKSLFGL